MIQGRSDPSAAAARARRARCAAWALLALALALHAFEARHLQPQIDDAYISYRYARNLAQGEGLVFNPGERVEGFTNLLWTLALAAGEAVGIDGPHAAHALGFLSGCALLVFGFLWTGQRLSPERAWLAGLAALCLWSSSAFAAWVLSGLETPLFAALTLAALLAQARARMGWATVAVVLATLTRPEGVLVAAALYAAELWPWWRHPRSILARPERWVPPLGYFATLILLTLFRLVYYGSPVPNTFYTKVGSVPIGLGELYLLAFLIEALLWLIVPITLGLRARVREASAVGGHGPRRAWADCVFVLLLFVYVLLVGGDVFRYGRFLLPALPFLIAVACSGTDAAFARSRGRGRVQLVLLIASIAWALYFLDALPVIVPVLAVASGLLPEVRRRMRAAPLLAAAVGVLLAFGSAEPLHGWNRIVGGVRSARKTVDHALLGSKRRALAKSPNFLSDREVARQIRQMRSLDPPVRLVAHTAIGRFGYASEVPILDLLGLVDERIARAGVWRAKRESDRREMPWGAILPGHQRSDPDYVFARRPDLIFIGRRNEEARYRQLPAVVDLWDDPRLDRDYRWRPRLRAYERRHR